MSLCYFDLCYSDVSTKQTRLIDSNKTSFDSMSLLIVSVGIQIKDITKLK